MDELIAKLRSQATETQRAQEIPSTNDMVITKECEMLNEATTSQADTPKATRFKLDFDVLRKHRESNAMRISEVKSSDLLKIEGPLWAIIKSIESYKGVTGCVYKWELIDESGVIFASSVVSVPNITVGSVISISDFSIWRLSGNHLNILERNIREVLN